MNKIQAVRGMNDILPDVSAVWQAVEKELRALGEDYGYQEIRLPIVEPLSLFARGIGEVTDIIEKEMYTFADRNQDELALRPEGTAGCVRAAVQHGLLHNQTQRWWYLGSMFRYERPQKGRYRQFHQFGLEAFGFSGPDIDAEVIAFSYRLWQRLGLQDEVTLQLNSLGDLASRATYRQVLIDYLTPLQDQLDEDSQRRLTTNPLRILDSKNPALVDIIAKAPRLIDHIDAESKQHLDELCTILDSLEITYQINPCLVRGLDYYTKTVFEWVTDSLGAQGTVCAGGRYDGLVEQLGGQTTPAIGFSIGMERLIHLVTAKQSAESFIRAPQVYLLAVGESMAMQAITLAEKIRSALPELTLLTHCGGGSFKSQIKKADKSGAKWALILAEDELAREEVGIKFLREDKQQRTVKLSELFAVLQQLVDEEK